LEKRKRKHEKLSKGHFIILMQKIKKEKKRFSEDIRTWRDPFEGMISHDPKREKVIHVLVDERKDNRKGGW
jgi:hypothetical protein